MTVAIIICLVFFFTIIHECGHLLMAKILKIPVTEFNYTFTPVPHFFVKTNWIENIKDRFLFLFSGLASTLIMFACLYFNDFFGFETFKKAIFIQIIIDTNPFFSDIVFAMIMPLKFENKSFYELYKANYMRHKFSLVWTVHLSLWVSLILIIFT